MRPIMYPVETNLPKLLTALAPRLLPEEYVFCSLPQSRWREAMDWRALASFREEEGLSLVLERPLALRHGFDAAPAMRCISLGAHSSLEAVGLTAAVAAKLAEAGISANVIAAFHHDHILVPADRALEALEALNELGAE